ncbi:hypothetical protein [Blastococcus capsensis]|uniref:hypothetical protein n=1 Tax=Blastococcus capsensis TaxID=1564163 RepID=UPI0032B03E01
MGFLGLVLATTVFSAVQLGWIPPDQGRVAAITAIAATVPLQLIASVIGFLTRDPIAATGMGVLAGAWAVTGLATLTTRPGATSAGLGVLLVTAGIALLIPVGVALSSKVVAAAVMASTAGRFVSTGIYEMSGSPAWKVTAGWVGLLAAVIALYAAAAFELEGTRERTVLPVGRRGKGRAAMAGKGPLEPAELVEEAGVRPQL